MERIEGRQAAPAVATRTAHSCFIVEDDPGIVRALSFTLRRAGFTTFDVKNPARIEAFLAECVPLAIFLDLGFGDASRGAEVLPRLAGLCFEGYVQLMSGRSAAILEDEAENGRRLGLAMLPPLTKPFRMGLVRAVAARIAAPPSRGMPDLGSAT